MTSPPHPHSGVRAPVARFSHRLVTLLLCLAVGHLSGCGKIADESRVFSAIAKILVRHGAVELPDKSAEPRPGPPLGSDASDQTARTALDARPPAQRTGPVIIEAEEASTLYEPTETPDSEAVFSYEDARGGTHMVRGLHKVPRKFQALARRLGSDNSPSLNRYDALSVVRNYAPKDVDPSSYFNPNRLDVTLFSATWCGACRKAKRLLDAEDVFYSVRDIDEDPDARDEVRRILGKVTIPLIDINGTYVSGYNRETILRLVKGS